MDFEQQKQALKKGTAFDEKTNISNLEIFFSRKEWNYWCKQVITVKIKMAFKPVRVYAKFPTCYGIGSRGPEPKVACNS